MRGFELQTEDIVTYSESNVINTIIIDLDSVIMLQIDTSTITPQTTWAVVLSSGMHIRVTEDAFERVRSAL